MKIKSWVLWLFSSICFLLVGIMNFIDKKYSLGIIFALLGVSYIFLSMSHYKDDENKNDKKQANKK